MEITDFRVGIIVEETQRYPFDKNFRGVIQLTAEDIRSIFEHGWFKGYVPVKITPEWLVKLGFKEISNNLEKHFIKDDFNWYSSSDEIVVELDNGISGYDLYTDCKHIHTLQNLYSNLKSKELVLSEA